MSGLTRSKKLHTLQISPEYPPYFLGGGGLLVQNLSECLISQGQNVIVASGYYPTKGPFEQSFTTNNGKLRIEWLPLLPTPKTSFQLKTIMPPNLFSAIKLIKILQSNHFHAIHIHGYGHFFCDYSSILCRIFKKKYVVTIHGFPKEPSRRGGILKSVFDLYGKILGSQLIKHAAKTVAVSRSVAKECLSFVGQERIVIIPNAVNLSGFTECSITKVDEVRKKYNLKGKKTLVCIGRLSENKGFQFVIQALPIIRKEISNAHLAIIGKDEGYGYLKTLRETADKNLVTHEVSFLRRVSDEEKIALLWLADVVVIPSIEEAFGIVALEALAAGAPIVASRIGGLEETLTGDKYSLLVRSSDVKEIAAAVTKILSDKNIALEARASRLSRIKPFSLDEMTEKYIYVYNGISNAVAVN
jgi:glycosyltransferase involved in cell wall biosynthesis